MSWEPPVPGDDVHEPRAKGWPEEGMMPVRESRGAEWTPSQIATSLGALIVVATICLLVLHWAGVI